MSISVGLVGYGYWGPNLARNFAVSDDFDLRWICDSGANARARATHDHRSVQVFDDLFTALADGVDLVAIATPPHTHEAIAKAALDTGAHLLVEKPLTLDSRSSLELVQLAQARGRHLFVDHTYLFTPAAMAVKGYIQGGALGEIATYDSTRMSLGLIQSETNVLWDLAIHDLALLTYWFEEAPVEVSCTGAVVHPADITATAHLTCSFETGLYAHIGVSWLSPVKLRSVAIGGSNKMLTFDDLAATEKIRIYDSGASVASDAGLRKISYRMGDIHVPFIMQREALGVELAEIAAVLKGEAAPRSDGQMGVVIARVLEAADRSILSGGYPQKVDR